MEKFRLRVSVVMVVTAAVVVFGGLAPDDASVGQVATAFATVVALVVVALLICPLGWEDIKAVLGLVRVEEGSDPEEDPDPFDYWQQDLDANPWRPDPDWSDRFRS